MLPSFPLRTHERGESIEYIKFTRKRVGVAMESIVIAVGLITGLSGLILGWLGKTRTIKKDIAAEASADTTLKINVEYIKSSIDEVRLDQKDQSRRFNDLDQRVTRVEEETKNAHRRINRIEGEGKQHG